MRKYIPQIKNYVWLKFAWNVYPALFALISLVSGTGAVFASSPSVNLEIEQQYSSDPLGKINAVSDLADVQPDDWAIDALKGLLQRYDLPTQSRAEPIDKLFRGDQALTRYEFAVGLDAVVNRINELVIAETPERVTQADWETIKRLQAEFAQELKFLPQRIEQIERVQDRIERQAFSPTTKLTGEVVFALAGVNNTDKADDSDEPTDSNLTFGNRARLNFNTSFTGEDLLRVRFQANDFPRIDRATGTDMANLAFRGSSRNDAFLTRLEYRFPIGEKATVYLEAVGGGLDDFTNTLNPFFSGSGRGSISRFAQRNPIYRQGGGAGVGILYEISDQVDLSLGYVADDAEDPEDGLTQGAYAAIAQITLEPSEEFRLGLTYVHSYNSLDTATGSRRANDPFDDESEAIAAHSLGLQSTIRLNNNLALSGWFGFTNVRAADLPNDPSANIINWAVTLAYIDLGTEDSVLGIAIGQQPKVINNDFRVAGRAYQDEDTSLHLEAFYRYEPTDNISITPGLLVITNPEHNSGNNTIYVGAIRTTFRF